MSTPVSNFPAPPVVSCEFYGKTMVGDFTLLPTLGNQCALIVHARAPCKMEVEDGEEPNWARCKRFNFNLS